jgi:hypothetical protein
MKTKEPIVSMLSWEEYQEAVAEGRVLPKYYIVNAMQSYVFVHTRNRVIAYEYFKEHYPQYTLRTSRQDGGTGAGCSETSSTRRGQSKFQSDFGIPQGLR